MTSRTALLLMASLAAAAVLEAAAPAKPTDAPAPKKRQRVVSDLSGFELLDAAKLKEKPVLTGATRSLFPKPPVILAPYLAKVHGAQPVFAWRHTSKRFAFSLSDAAGKELHAAEVEGLSYTWPASAPHLADGATYAWTVKPIDPPAPAATVEIVMVTKAERAQLDKALAAAHEADAYASGLARGAAFTEKRIWYDAVAAYTDLIARFPDRPEAYERRGDLYAQMLSMQDAAHDDFDRADKLTQN
jgi:hypothetical protein